MIKNNIKKNIYGYVINLGYMLLFVIKVKKYINSIQNYMNYSNISINRKDKSSIPVIYSRIKR